MPRTSTSPISCRGRSGSISRATSATSSCAAPTASIAYQLAVVVDDAAQGITTVVRGADLLASTPRQIFLQRLLGVATPAYLHVPVALTARGEKLSKQTHARALPDAPLPALLAAWRFLDQRAPPAAIGSVAEFWQWAIGAWSRRALPPVPMLPAPRAFDGGAPIAADTGGRV